MTNPKRTPVPSFRTLMAAPTLASRDGLLKPIPKPNISDVGSIQNLPVAYLPGTSRSPIYDSMAIRYTVNYVFDSFIRSMSKVAPAVRHAVAVFTETRRERAIREAGEWAVAHVHHEMRHITIALDEWVP